MEKLIITACICGAEVTKENNPAVPYTVEEIANEAYAAYKAGASIIHLHVRYDDGTPTQDKARFKECMDAIYAKCPDIIIQPSTGGAVGMSNDERLQPIELMPEMATLDCGTCNFGGDDIFVNTENTIKYFGERMIERNIKPEVEVFDKGMIDMAIRLNKKGYIKSPMHFDFVMGVNGGISGTPRDL
ncbi:MAG: 3-keto-5-aminohexanoate cleavage protein, partial [Clostridiales bacterium]|nr:3-keto-5-aminohexanoate cleavage protein [Clostridiales bacterium]